MDRFATPRSSTKRVRPALALLSTLSLIGHFAHADESRLDTIKRKGEIVMLTHASTTTCYEGPSGTAGFEHDLAALFADHLGVRLRVAVVDRFADVLPHLLEGRADFAAGIPVTPQRKKLLRLTPPYQQVRLQFVYRHGNVRPRRLADLEGREIEVPAGTIYAERLRALKARYPELEWAATEERGQEAHLQRVWQGLLDVTLTDSNTFAANRPYYPDVLVGFSLREPAGLAWAVRKTEDDSLYQEAVRFLAAQRRSGVLAQLVDRYYGPGSRANFINLTVFHRRVRARLPRYRALFEQAGAKYDLDWRLLAALAYQESYWDPTSVSPTGVRGFMMLTRATAREVGVENRLDTRASIDGGARYLRSLIDRLPKRIRHPDRRWLALAAYNVGPSHLEDARVLTQKLGGDPDRWNDVRQHLPLLADPKWHKQTRHGYARGHEPVQYVDRVRVFYRALLKIEGAAGAAAPARAPEPRVPSI